MIHFLTGFLSILILSNYIYLMMTFVQYVEFIFCMMPVFSAMTCGLLTILSNRDSLSRTEIKLKNVLSVYLLLAGVAWFCTFSFRYFPGLFVYLNASCYFTFLTVQVSFYHFFYILTKTNEQDRFNWWHYAPPVFIFALMQIWSLFIPLDVQEVIVESRNTHIITDYEWYTRFFFTKPEMRLVYSLIYVSLTLFRLNTYYHVINHASSMIRRPKAWVWSLIILVITSILSALFATFLSREAAFKSPLLIFTSVIIMIQHIILTYYIVRRQFLLYVVVKEKKDTAESTDTENLPKKKIKPTIRKITMPLTKKSLETYMRKEKPYLKPHFKMIDLEEVFGTNRTYISNFINETYGVNFNRYLNRLRLKEMERLLKQSSNAGKTTADLIRKAGFTDSRHYHRALTAEKEKNI